MNMDKGSPIRNLTVYEASLDDIYDVDPHDGTVDKFLKPIKEFMKLQLGPKPGQRTQLNKDLTSHKHKRIADVPHRNAYLFAW